MVRDSPLSTGSETTTWIRRIRLEESIHAWIGIREVTPFCSSADTSCSMAAREDTGTTSGSFERSTSAE
jgi:hypothetical protein